jgi:hypothetical protein
VTRRLPLRRSDYEAFGTSIVKLRFIPIGILIYVGYLAPAYTFKGSNRHCVERWCSLMTNPCADRPRGFSFATYAILFHFSKLATRPSICARPRPAAAV